jgi:hypothetical protein
MDDIKNSEFSRKKASGKVNKCIGCDVMNCYYHDPSNYCSAEQINIGPKNAETSAETICSTFKPKEE